MKLFSGRAFLLHTTGFVSAMNVNANRLIGGEHMRNLRSDQIEYSEGKELQAIITPKEIDVDPLSTYNEKFMALMNSPCRPEYDGFFGATSGDPIRVQYGLRVEVEPLSAIMDILDAIEDKVVDSILQSSFPEMCGVGKTENRNRSLLHTSTSHPSGFRFLKFEEAEKCLPQENEVNFCGIFTGALYVYGKNQNEAETSRIILSYINNILDNVEPRDLHSELALLSRVDKFSEVDGGSTNQPFAKGRLSRLDILLIIVSSMIVAALTYYVYIQRRERRHISHKFPDESYGVNEFEGNDDEDKFVDEDLQLEPYRDSRTNGIILH